MSFRQIKITDFTIASGIIKLGIKILRNMSLVMQSVGGLSDRLFLLNKVFMSHLL